MSASGMTYVYSVTGGLCLLLYGKWPTLNSPLLFRGMSAHVSAIARWVSVMTHPPVVLYVTYRFVQSLPTVTDPAM